MTDLQGSWREIAAQALAEHVDWVHARRDNETVDVCRFHYDLVDIVLGAVDVVPRSEAEALAETLGMAVFNGERYRAEAIIALAEYRAAHPRECTQLSEGSCVAGCPACDPREETP